mmetsp:Transcript_90580/g.255729  ORF Transcript_90580/g.255729 Transcript_90580/m.255729 type:complete len:257 (+) Transcript_90580:663-1433(+)
MRLCGEEPKRWRRFAAPADSAPHGRPSKSRSPRSMLGSWRTALEAASGEASALPMLSARSACANCQSGGKPSHGTHHTALCASFSLSKLHPGGAGVVGSPPRSAMGNMCTEPNCVPNKPSSTVKKRAATPSRSNAEDSPPPSSIKCVVFVDKSHKKFRFLKSGSPMESSVPRRGSFEPPMSWEQTGRTGPRRFVNSRGCSRAWNKMPRSAPSQTPLLPSPSSGIVRCRSIAPAPGPAASPASPIACAVAKATRWPW